MKSLDQNEIGEIVIKSPKDMFVVSWINLKLLSKYLKQFFQGYYKNDEATNKVFIENGFFKTGDLGYFDEDGLLYITDRRVDTIRFTINGIVCC